MLGSPILTVGQAATAIGLMIDTDLRIPQSTLHRDNSLI